MEKKPHISSEEALRVFTAANEVKQDAIRVCKLIVQKIHRYKIQLKNFEYYDKSSKELIRKVTNDSVYIYNKKGELKEKRSIHKVSLETIVMLNLILGEIVTLHTKGKY